MSHHTGSCPFFFFFSFLFLWNLSFWGVRERAPASQALQGPALGWRCHGLGMCVICAACQAVRSSEPSRLGNEEPKKRQIPGPLGTWQKQRRQRDVWWQLGPGPPPLTFLHYSFSPSRTPPHMLCPTRKKGGHIFRCVLSEKSNSSCLSLGVPSSSPGSG